MILMKSGEFFCLAGCQIYFVESGQKPKVSKFDQKNANC